MANMKSLWHLTVFVQLLCIIVCQNADPPPGPPRDNAAYNTTEILRSRNYRDLWLRQGIPNGRILYVAETPRGARQWDVNPYASDTDVDALRRDTGDTLYVDHVLELNQAQDYLRRLGSVDPTSQISRDWLDIARENRISLGPGDRRDRQEEIARILNEYGRGGNLAGIISRNRFDVTGDGINRLKNKALTKTIGRRWNEATIVNTQLYMGRVEAQYYETANRLQQRIGEGVPGVWDNIFDFADTKWRSAERKLEARLAALRNGRKRRRQTQTNPRFWSNAFLNEGNGVYVALGDSYSAGLGAGDVDPSTQTATNTRFTCRRYSDSYPNRLNREMQPTRFDYWACSSATTREVRDEQLPLIDPWASFITMTIGGNDVGFADIAKACVYNIGPFLSRCNRNPVNCCNQLLDEASTNIDLLYSTLVPLYRDIQRRAPNANILILGYPAFYNADTLVLNGNCPTPRDRRRRLNDMGTKLNGVIERAARDAGVAYLDPNPAFNGHRFCERRLLGRSPAWFFSNEATAEAKRSLPQHPHARTIIEDLESLSLNATDSVGLDVSQPLDLDLFDPLGLDVSSMPLEKRQLLDTDRYFHPTRRGQQAYYDIALQRANQFPVSTPQDPESPEDDGDE